MNLYNQKPLSVSAFIELANTSLSQIEAFVEGEISQFNISHSKWAFFSLKDQEAVVECFMPVFEIKVAVEIGMKVLIYGIPGIHKKSGRFRIRVYKIEPSGEGALKRAFELTKAKLQAQGLFAIERKRPLPEFPENIALITSKESAAYSDFIKVLRHRQGGLKIYLAHVHVQGIEAIDEIVDAFRYFNDNALNLNLDAVVLIRGGGSLEDLQAFNSEEVAFAIFGSKVPVLVGIGHERDETLADYTADVRASTPSNAAEILVRSKEEIEFEIQNIENRIQNSFQETIKEKKFLIEKFFLHSTHFVKDKKTTLEGISNLLSMHFLNFNEFFLKSKEDFKEKIQYFNKIFLVMIQKTKDNLTYEERLLESFNPLKILNRGYAIVKDKKNNKILQSVKEIKKEQILNLTMKDGVVESSVLNINY